MPKPPKLNPERMVKILEAVKFGIPAHKAAIATGVTERTHFNWLKRGRDLLEQHENDIDEVPEKAEDYIYAQYAAKIEQSQAEGEGRLVLLISQEAPKTWQAAAWLLERTHPETYGRRERLDANVNGNLGVTFAETLTEAAKRRREEFERRRAAQDAGEAGGD